MEQIIDLVIANPIVLKIALFMAGARLIFKPLCAGIQAYVDASESLVDNELWGKIQASPIFKGLAYALDLIASIKLPK